MRFQRGRETKAERTSYWYIFLLPTCSIYVCVCSKVRSLKGKEKTLWSIMSIRALKAQRTLSLIYRYVLFTSESIQATEQQTSVCVDSCAAAASGQLLFVRPAEAQLCLFFIYSTRIKFTSGAFIWRNVRFLSDFAVDKHFLDPPPGDPIIRCHSVHDIQPSWPWTHTLTHTLCLINSWPSTQDWITAAASARFTWTTPFVAGTPLHTHTQLQCFITHTHTRSSVHDMLSLFVIPHFPCLYS